LPELGCFVTSLLLSCGGCAFAALVIALSLRRRVEAQEAQIKRLQTLLSDAAPPWAEASEAAGSHPEKMASPLATEPDFQNRTGVATNGPVDELPLAATPFQSETDPDPVRATPHEAPDRRAIPIPVAPPVFVPPTVPPARSMDLSQYPGEPSPTPPPPPIAPPPIPPAQATPFDWESLVGVKLFSWIAGLALALAAVFFLRYSIENGWLSPPVQMAIGLLAGIALVVLSELRIAERYRATANAFDGAGIAILYATLFASHSIWRLLGTFAVFLLMSLVTALAVYLSIRRNSLFIALLGLVAGFATPALLSSGQDRPITLFGYLLILNVGLAWVAHQRRWPVLTALSLTLTTIYQWWWVVTFMDATKLPIAIGIFLLFPLVTVMGAVFADRTGEGERSSAWSTRWSAALPVLFAVYAAAIPSYGANYRLLFGFLLIVSAGLAAISAARGPEMLHTMGAVGTVVAFVLWTANSYTNLAWPHILFITVLFLVIYYSAPFIAANFGKPFPGGGRRARQIITMLLFVFVALAGMENEAAPGLMLLGTMMALLVAIGIYAARFDCGEIFVIAGLFSLLTQAFWFYGTPVPPSFGKVLLVFTAYALIYAAIPLLSLTFPGTTQVRPAVSRGQYLILGSFFLIFLFALRGGEHSRAAFLVALFTILLAALAAAHFGRRGFLQACSLLAFPCVLIAWIIVVKEEPTPVVAMLAALAGGLLGCVSWRIAFKNDEDSAGIFAFGAATALFVGQVVVITAVRVSGHPPFAVTFAVQLALVVLLLWLASATQRHVVAVLASLLSFLVLFGWLNPWDTSAVSPKLIAAGAVYAAFLLYPLLLREKIKRWIEPHLAAIFASVCFFFYVRPVLRHTPLESIIGLLPLAQALLLGGLLLALLRTEKVEERYPGRLALIAGAALAFLTLAIPLQFEKEWITLGWALEVAALSWLYTRIPHRGLLHWTTALGGVVLIRLTLNPAVFEYHARSTQPVLNWYLYTYLIAAGSFFLAGFFLRRTQDRYGILPKISSLCAAAGTLLLFLLLNIEIADYYSTGDHLAFNFSAGLAQDLTYTLAWAIFAIALLVAGIVARKRPARIASLALLVIAILKCFLHDLGRLGGLYRVGSLLGLALCLGFVAILLQKFVFLPKERREGESLSDSKRV